MQYQTRIEFYKNEKAMHSGIRQWEAAGWEVVGTEAIDEGYGCAKTVFLGCLFLPLALLGKKPQRYKVEYRAPALPNP